MKTFELIMTTFVFGEKIVCLKLKFGNGQETGNG